MKQYQELDEKLKLELEEIVLSDRYGLKAESLYKNIYNSYGNTETLAQIFAVKVSLVKKIKAC
jgi:hypothetical protein